MTDQPVHEPMEPDPERDRVEPDDGSASAEQGSSLTRPSAAEGAEEDVGARPPRPSQAEGDRDEA